MDWFKDKILPLRGRLVKYANNVLNNHDEAEDIAQETLIKLWYNRNKFEMHPNIESLAYLTTKNLALNRKKVLARRAQSGIDNNECEDQYAEQDENTDKTKVILKIIETLPSLQKSIFILKHIKGYETDEIAQITGTNVDAVRMNLSRARKKIRDVYLNIKS